jgi:hypothetical protein
LIEMKVPSTTKYECLPGLYAAIGGGPEPWPLPLLAAAAKASKSVLIT